MSDPPQKRRKMRPNNPITKERDKNAPKNRIEKTADSEEIPKAIPNQQPTRNTIKRKRKPLSKPSPKPSPKQYSSASDSDETDKESSPPARRPPVAIPIKRPRIMINKKTPAPKPKKPTQGKRRRVTKEDFSDSDSDSDKENQVKLKIKRRPAASPNNTRTPSEGYSASDSDETDQETNTTTANNTNHQEIVTQETNDVNLGTTADKTDQPSNTEKNSADSGSDSDSDETDNEEQPQKTQHHRSRSNSKKFKTSEYIDDSDNPDSGVSEDETPQPIEFRKPATRNNLEVDRISFRKKKSYDPSKDTAFNLRQRFNDLFIPNVSGNEFISDSDSDSSDSGDDYENKYYEPWQRTLGHNRHPDKNGVWPKHGKLGYSDKLKLEKRIKKICRREGMTFENAREIFSNRKEGQLRFFQKIGKIFPNMPLYRLTKLCKEMYHVKRNNSPWTPEEITQLEELVKIHGRNPETIAKYMDRSPKNITDFFFSRGQKTAKASKRWTQEEDEKLAKAIAEERKRNPDKISYLAIEPLFKGERSQLQIYGRAANIKHRVQPDGTLVPKRRATPQEELEYLEMLMKQVEDNNLTEESQLNLTRDRGFVAQSFYLRRRNKIDNFETMHVRDILNKLIKQQKKMLETEAN